MFRINAFLKKQQKNPELYLLWFSVILIFISLYTYSSEVSSAVLDSLKLCAVSVIPALFPFFIANIFAVESGLIDFISVITSKISKVLFDAGNYGAAAFILGIIGGYPAGAECIARLYSSGKCNSDEAERMLSFCNNTGPAFPVVFIGITLYNDYKIGLTLYILQVLSAIIIGFAMRFTKKQKNIFLSEHDKKNTNPEKKYKSFSEILITSISDSSLIMLRTCGFIVAFAVLGAMIKTFLLKYNINSNIITMVLGTLEITAGVDSSAMIGGRIGFIICGIIFGWSGLSVHMQTIAVFKRIEGGLKTISAKKYFLGKILQSIIIGILSFFIYPML